MYKMMLLTGLLLVCSLAIVALPLDDVIGQADALNEQDEHSQAIELLESALPEVSNSEERAEIFWRLSRAHLQLGDQRKKDGSSEDQLLSIFENGGNYANQAIEADPANVNGYFWKSTNIGRWGQTKGIYESLTKASEMRDLLIESIDIDSEHADSYFVLSQLYAAVPRLISFGNNDYAVNLARKSIALMEEQISTGARDFASYSFYITLAEALNERGWSQRKRNREHQRRIADYQAATSPLERGWYYEGTISIPEMPDTQEAEMILRDIIQQIERKPNPRIHDLRDLDDARTLINEL